jgi:hypothetical protein
VHTPELSEQDFRAAQRKQILEDRAAARQRLIDRLYDEDEDALAARLEKCGEPLPLTCTSCGLQKMAFTRCDLKWCPSCAPRLAHDKVTRYDPICSTFQNPLFLTITCKNYRSQKHTGIRELRQAFTQLRRLRWWKRCCAGGVASFELTNKGAGWHPHIHALLDSSWLAVQVPKPAPGSSAKQYKDAARRACEEVAEQMSLALGRPASVKGRRRGLRSGASAALKEVIKYSIKPQDLDKTKARIGPMLHELSKTRNLVSWGTAYRHPTLKKPVREACPCEQCNNFATYMPDAVIAMIARRS